MLIGNGHFKKQNAHIYEGKDFAFQEMGISIFKMSTLFFLFFHDAHEGGYHSKN